MMVPAYNMSTTPRHMKLVSRCERELEDSLSNYETYNLSREQTDLVYWNEDNCIFKLVDAENLEMSEEIFLSEVINSMDYVMPDIMLFQKNKYVANKNQTKTAGFPDLIIEVWSDGNKNEHRNFKRKLYATSQTTEFWQITQNSNIVKCSIGNKKIMDKSLTEPMQTLAEIPIDLTHLAL